MKNQALFSLKDKSKKLKCRLQQFSFGALRVNIFHGHGALGSLGSFRVSMKPMLAGMDNVATLHY